MSLWNWFGYILVFGGLIIILFVYQNWDKISKDAKKAKEDKKINDKLVTIKVAKKETHQHTNYYVKYKETTEHYSSNWNNGDSTYVKKTRTKTKTFTNKGQWNVFIEKCRNYPNLSIEDTWKEKEIKLPTNNKKIYSHFCKSEGMILTLHSDIYWGILEVIDKELNNELIRKESSVCKHGYWSIGIPNQYSIKKTLSKYIKNDTTLNKYLTKVKKEYDALQNIKYAWKKQEKVLSDFPSDPLLKNFNKLRPHQISAYNLLKKYNSFPLFWESKTGKKAPVITSTIAHKKIMISVPTGQENKWVKEYSKWTHRKDVVVLTGETIEQRKLIYEQFNNAESQILIVASSTLTKDIIVKDEFNTITAKGIWMPKNFDMFIVDDASFLQYSKPRNTLTHFVLRDFSKYTIVLSNHFSNIKEKERNGIYGMLKFLKPDHKITKNMMNTFFFEGRPNRSYDWYDFWYLRKNKRDLWIEFIETYTFPIELKEVNKWIRTTKPRVKKNTMNKKQN